MLNKIDKPKQSSTQIINKMKDNGIKFNYITEAKALEYLLTKNNYFRTASYRKNYQKYCNLYFYKYKIYQINKIYHMMKLFYFKFK